MPKTIQKTISMPCHPKFLKEVRSLLEETLAEAKLEARKRDQIILAVDEAVASVIQYAKFKGYDHEIALTIDINDPQMTFSRAEGHFLPVRTEGNRPDQESRREDLFQ